jgi:hypothetical protein
MQVSKEVHDWLSRNGRKGAAAGSKKGGQTTKRLIEAGRRALGEHRNDEIEFAANEGGYTDLNDDYRDDQYEARA